MAAAAGPKPNNLRIFREDLMMSKAELARRAEVSVLTVDRIERGENCRMGTMRKLLEAMGIPIVRRIEVFPHLGEQNDSRERERL
ncbi:helix-turn-helix domain-containing protein [Patescibacteria group bacterium]|nr:helix-turn-helix domain-containing protein [Patescibacteria group bacterium]